MTYRRVQIEDLPKIKELCQKSGIQFDMRKPLVGFVAVGDSGELIGFVFAHQCALIEPFVCLNPTASVKLNSMIEGAVSALGIETKIVHVPDSNKKLNAEVVRSGYSKIDPVDFTLYKKE